MDSRWILYPPLSTLDNALRADPNRQDPYAEAVRLPDVALLQATVIYLYCASKSKLLDGHPDTDDFCCVGVAVAATHGGASTRRRQVNPSAWA